MSRLSLRTLMPILALSIGPLSGCGGSGNTQSVTTTANAVRLAQIVPRITPPKGKAGQQAVIHGTGFTGLNIEVRFGSAPAVAAANPGGSDQVIKCLVPQKEPADPAIVAVTIEIDHVPVPLPEGLFFEYTRE